MTIYSEAIDGNLHKMISRDRFQRYLDWSNDTPEEALKLYALNTTISESLYSPLQMLEIILRNRINDVLAIKHGKYWFDTILLIDHQKENVADVRTKLANDKKEETAGRIVSELTFGFWTTLLGKTYENLWQQDLNQIAKKTNGKGFSRKELQKPLTPIRALRNRIAHHEAILHWGIIKHYGAILELITWMHPPSLSWVEHHSRFEKTLPGEFQAYSKKRLH